MVTISTIQFKRGKKEALEKNKSILSDTQKQLQLERTFCYLESQSLKLTLINSKSVTENQNIKIFLISQILFKAATYFLLRQFMNFLRQEKMINYIQPLQRITLISGEMAISQLALIPARSMLAEQTLMRVTIAEQNQVYNNIDYYIKQILTRRNIWEM